MSKKKKYVLKRYSPDLKYSCIGCGKCCGSWQIPASKTEKDRISSFELEGFTPHPADCFIETANSPETFLIKKNPHTGNCIFLDDKKLCLIHSSFGSAAKPLGCRLYPFEIFSWGDGTVSVSPRFDCPAVDSSTDAPSISMHIKDLENLACELRIHGKDADAIYSKDIKCQLEELRIISDSYKNILLNEDFPVLPRLLFSLRLIEFHALEQNRSDLSKISSSFKSDSLTLASRSIADLNDEIENAPEPDIRLRIFFRHLVSGFMRSDTDDENILESIGKKLSRTFNLLRFILGKGRFSDFPVGLPDADEIFDPFMDLCKADFPAESFGPYWKYLKAKLDSMHFCGTPSQNLTFEEGMRKLAFTFPVVLSIAAHLALRTGIKTVGECEIRKAIGLVDHTFSHSAFFALPKVKKIFRTVTSPVNAASILARIKIIP